MGIKEILIQKKLEKTASPLELFIAPKIFQAVEELVKTTHNAEADKLKDELKAYTSAFFARFEQLSRQIEQSIQAETTTKKDESIKAITRMMADLETFKVESFAKIDEYNRKITAQSQEKVNEVLNKLESLRGPKGDDGKTGARGADGSPDTPQEVVSKVNKAKGVKISAIDGLEEELKKAKKGGGKAAGGMGNVQHETKPVSSGTTSVSTTYPVAAGGRAAWLYYQGQFLVYGTHYTIAGSTVTLTFDKVDGTFIDITYIR